MHAHSQSGALAHLCGEVNPRRASSTVSSESTLVNFQAAPAAGKRSSAYAQGRQKAFHQHPRRNLDRTIFGRAVLCNGRARARKVHGFWSALVHENLMTASASTRGIALPPCHLAHESQGDLGSHTGRLKCGSRTGCCRQGRSEAFLMSSLLMASGLSGHILFFSHEQLRSQDQMRRSTTAARAGWLCIPLSRAMSLGRRWRLSPKSHQSTPVASDQPCVGLL